MSTAKVDIYSLGREGMLVWSETSWQPNGTRERSDGLDRFISGHEAYFVQLRKAD